MAIPVEVAWTQEDGAQVNEHAETEILNAHGALLRMKPHFPIPIDIHLSRPGTRLSTQARVVGLCELIPGGLLGITVELAAPSQTFWGISFSPAPSTSPSQMDPEAG